MLLHKQIYNESIVVHYLLASLSFHPFVGQLNINYTKWLVATINIEHAFYVYTKVDREFLRGNDVPILLLASFRDIEERVC